jgi:3-hydroxyisobutyrate dehydrogenase-like beta-hydroxyacid dehydrogenase
MKVGFIGLGRMGKGMARRVLESGHELTVYDVLPAATAEFGAAGARVAASPAELCKGREVIITMLVEDATVLEVTLSAGGLRDSLSPGAIHLAMGTYGVATIRTLAEAHEKAGQVLVAAPVLGRPGSCSFRTTRHCCGRAFRGGSAMHAASPGDGTADV